MYYDQGITTRHYAPQQEKNYPQWFSVRPIKIFQKHLISRKQSSAEAGG